MMLGLTQQQLRSLAQLRGEIVPCDKCGRAVPDTHDPMVRSICPRCTPEPPWPASVPRPARPARDWDRTSVLVAC